ncbi:uncharacterized protein LOC126801790 [Argentina anserina]|uniref:uncharacterized protein LOC126801790 n=1 Tax=Argentina anserina TaxID=57926 RepID=UPI0021766121|nr:uncharacterized protein LOC126801790 [Potentilla anserina]
MEREFLDSTAGGSFLHKSNVVANDLLEKRAINNQQFGTSASSTRQVHKTNSSSNSALEDMVDKLSKMMSQFMRTSIAQVCGICTEGHPTDQCSQHTSGRGYEEVNALSYQGGQGYNPFSNTYNPGLRGHPNFWWSNNDNVLRPQHHAMQYGPRPSILFARPQAPHLNVTPPNVTSAPNYEEMLKSLAAGQRKLPSGVITNPRDEQVQAIITRSGLELVDQPRVLKKTQTGHIADDDEEIVINKDLEKDPTTSKKESVPFQEAPKGTSSNSSDLVKTNHISFVPFPSRFAKIKKDKSDEEVLEVFRKVQVNLPLLECIKQISKYAKCLKELCTSRRQTREENVVKMNETVWAVIQWKLPTKMKDP